MKYTLPSAWLAQLEEQRFVVWEFSADAVKDRTPVRFIDLSALACTSNLHEPHQNKNHSW